jgi:large subunit ribosomal protein L9
MKVILLENVKNIGQKGEIKEIKDGYAMNFLIPQKKATIATKGNVKQAELDQVKQLEINKENLEKNKKEAKDINGKKVVITAKSQGEKLFGSLSEKEIKVALDKANLKLVNGRIKIPTPIKTTGEHEIEVDWNEDLKVKFNLVVEGEK